jgi:hypothetical protein
MAATVLMFVDIDATPSVLLTPTPTNLSNNEVADILELLRVSRGLAAPVVGIGYDNVSNTFFTLTNSGINP